MSRFPKKGNLETDNKTNIRKQSLAFTLFINFT